MALSHRPPARQAAARAFPAPLNPLRCVSLAAAALCNALPAQAQPAAAPAALSTLPKVVATASRVQSTQDEVPATVHVITAEEIDRLLPGDLQDLLRHENGVSVRALPNRSSAAFYATGRGGNEGINIRGLEGNQVMLQVDGVRLPMAYASGPFAAGRGDYIDPEAFKRVELLRGPSSTSYGSDGLAGAVSFVTKDPADLLTLGQPVQGTVKFGWRSADRSFGVMPAVAARGERFEALLLASLRRGHEAETMGSVDAANNTRTLGNPQQARSDYLLGKLVWRIDPRQRVKLTAERLDRRIDTEVYTLFGDASYPTTTDVDAREDIERTLLKADYEFLDARAPWIQRAQASLYVQDSSNRQFGFERRSNTTAWNTRSRDTRYGEQTVGASAQAESHFGGALTHRLVYGLDLSTTRVDSLKDGANYLNGTLVSSGSSAFVTNKSFPDTDYRLYGAFVQDELGFGRLSVIPGLRLDRFELRPRQDDPLYAVSNSQVPARLSGQEASPKLGFIWRQAPLLQVFGQYAHGFRAPTPSMVNGGVTNLTASAPYKSIGNPGLKPETSDSVELGLRGADRQWRYSASVFRARYQDFIAANQKVGGAGTASDPTVYQSVNLDSVVIHGFELGGAWVFRPQWKLSASLSHLVGNQTTGGSKTPLATIDPDKLVLGLLHEQPGVWGGELTMTAVERQRRNPTAGGFTPPGYAVFDLSAWRQLGRHTRVNVGLHNLFDRKHWQWADVRDLAATSKVLDAYSQPGVSLVAGLRHEF